MYFDYQPSNFFEIVSPCCDNGWKLGISFKSQSEYLSYKRLQSKENPKKRVYHCTSCGRNFTKFKVKRKLKEKPL